MKKFGDKVKIIEIDDERQLFQEYEQWHRAEFTPTPPNNFMSPNVQSGSSSRNNQSFSSTQFMNDEVPDDMEKVIIVMGPKHEGKSSLINFLVGDASTNNGCKTETDARQTDCEIVHHDGKKIKFVEAPGFPDLNSEEDLIASKISKFIDDHEKISGIIIVKEFGKIGVSSSARSVYNGICEIFPNFIPTNFCVVFTKWSMSPEKIEQRKADGQQYESYIAKERSALEKSNPVLGLCKVQDWFKSDSKYCEHIQTEVCSSKLDRNLILQWACSRTHIRSTTTKASSEISIQPSDPSIRTIDDLVLFVSSHHDKIAENVSFALGTQHKPLKRTFFEKGWQFHEYAIHYKQKSMVSKQTLLGFQSTHKFHDSHDFGEKKLLQTINLALNALSMVEKIQNVRVIAEQLQKRNIYIQEWKFLQLQNGKKTRTVCVLYVHFMPVVMAKLASLNGFGLPESFFSKYQLPRLL